MEKLTNSPKKDFENSVLTFERICPLVNFHIQKLFTL